jgi:hypothetical protein
LCRDACVRRRLARRCAQLAALADKRAADGLRKRSPIGTRRKSRASLQQRGVRLCCFSGDRRYRVDWQSQGIACSDSGAISLSAATTIALARRKKARVPDDARALLFDDVTRATTCHLTGSACCKLTDSAPIEAALSIFYFGLLGTIPRPNSFSYGFTSPSPFGDVQMSVRNRAYTLWARMKYLLPTE